MQSLYGLPTQSHDNLNQQAHPGGGTETIAIASGEGLVEDQYEAQLKSLYVAYREPTAGRLAALAGDLEEIGCDELAEEVDEVLAGFYEVGLAKEAATPSVGEIGLMMGMTNPMGAMQYAAVYPFLRLKDHFYDQEEGLEEDTSQLIEEIKEWKEDDDLKNEIGVENEIGDALIRILESFKEKMLGTQATYESMIAKPSVEMAQKLVQDFQDARALLKDAEGRFTKFVGVRGREEEWRLDFRRTKSLFLDVHRQFVKLEERVAEAAAEFGQKIQPADAAGPTRDQPQPQAKLQEKVVAPVQKQNVVVGPAAQTAVQSAQAVLQEYDRLKVEVNSKKMVPGAGQKILALQTPAFQGALKNLKENLLPNLQSGHINPDRGGREERFADSSIKAAQDQIQLFYQGLDAIN